MRTREAMQEDIKNVNREVTSPIVIEILLDIRELLQSISPIQQRTWEHDPAKDPDSGKDTLKGI